MLLTGTFARAIDDKLRVAIPKRQREAFGPVEPQWLFIAPGTDGSLALYTEETFAGLAARLAASSPHGTDVRAFNRMFYAQAQRVELDSQGRIRIPIELAQLAKLGKEAVLIGVQDHLELWDQASWNTYLSERQNRYDEIAEAAFRQTIT
ncbi:MAG: division/cell wall cluster transcriptional repressor MraZ [Planctomycetota bacterium]|nr:division/cell wall cluster transcriptional repressor MraZ [Planctomycetota bacterium]